MQMPIRKMVLVLMTFLLVLPSFPKSSFSNEGIDEDSTVSDTGNRAISAKDEVIYANLDAAGKQRELYVVNTFHVTEPGQITDYGDYTSISNLTNLTEMKQTQDNAIQFETDEGEFYYQGNMDGKALPWNIAISYVLDGEKISPSELAGKDGKLEIHLSTTANEEVDPIFFENYLLQISLKLDPAIFNEIQAPDGNEANAGKDKQITFTVMPEQEEELVVEANVENFEMDPIEIAATPYSMAMESPDVGGMTDDMQSLSSAIAEVNDGVGQLNQGISDLNTGASELSNGSTEYRNGITELSRSSSELINGSTSIQDALQTMNESLQASSGSMDISELKALPDGLEQIAGGLQETAAGLDTLKENYSTAYGTLDEAITAIPAYEINDADIEALYESGANEDVVNKLVETYAAAQTVKRTYSSVREAFAAVDGTLVQVSGAISEMAENLETIAAEFSSSIEEMGAMEGLAELQEGLSTLATKYESFHSGLVSYTDGISELSGSYSELDDGIKQLSEGTSSLHDGASELQNGTSELQESTDNLPGQIESEVDSMMEEYDYSDFEPVSFVSPKIDKVDTVQFVLQTESIEIEEAEPEEDNQEVEKSFWDRLLDLF
ncbi:YhgE/Pip domain-containing protein [Oceanobacillus massiliensis]|uniref:YhgE/Pip domain-containing protein n=1 Tax=Oceanobacillus massiliensis TaxID=1465765 RepID=UPI00301B1A13